MNNAAPDALRAPLPSLPNGWHVLSYAVLAGSRLAVVATDVDIQSAWRTDRAHHTVGEAPRAAAKATAKAWIFDGSDLADGPEFPLLEPFPLIDQFPDGRWLVANARSWGRQNARILSAEGAEQRRIELGDGIQRLMIDNRHRIWVGWFDEGVFGNDQWRVPGLKWPPSAHGIAAFDDQGAIVTHASKEAIADCYALNVIGATAWACTYTDFPIWELSETVERTWQTGLSGTRALAVKYPYVLAAGGYKDDSNRVVLLKLTEHMAQRLQEWRLPLPVGYPVEVSLIDGRDDEIHAVTDDIWYRWRLGDFLAGPLANPA